MNTLKEIGAVVALAAALAVILSLCEAIANLPRRATWTEPGKTYEGCWGPDPHLPIVQVYWSDRTVVAIPRRALVPLTRI